MFTLLLLSCTLATAYALTFSVPDNITACQPITCTWAGGQAPYTITFYNASGTGPNAKHDPTPLNEFTNLTGNSYTYNVGVPGGSTIVFMIEDSGQNEITTPGLRIGGSDNSCTAGGNYGKPDRWDPSSNGSSTNVGAIVGGVIGGLAVIAAVVIALLFFFSKRRKRQEEESDHEKNLVTPYPHDMDNSAPHSPTQLLSTSPIDNAEMVTSGSGPVTLSTQGDDARSSLFSQPDGTASTSPPASHLAKESRRYSVAAAKLREAETLRKQNAPRSEAENNALMLQISELRREVNVMKSQRAHSQAREEFGEQSPPAYEA